MASPNVTYTLTNGTTADASQVQQNFTDLINAMTDSSKSFSIDALTVAGAAAFNGAVTLGNAAGDAINVIGTFAADTITEYTSTNGTQIKGRTSNTAIAAGYIGEIVPFSNAVYTDSAATGIKNITSFTLKAGLWRISGSFLFGTAATYISAKLSSAGGTSESFTEVVAGVASTYNMSFVDGASRVGYISGVIVRNTSEITVYVNVDRPSSISITSTGLSGFAERIG